MRRAAVQRGIRLFANAGRSVSPAGNRRASANARARRAPDRPARGGHPSTREEHIMFGWFRNEVARRRRSVLIDTANQQVSRLNAGDLDAGRMLHGEALIITGVLA